MQENILTWNLPNWITVFLMGALGFAILGAVSGIVRARRSGGDDSAAA